MLIKSQVIPLAVTLAVIVVSIIAFNEFNFEIEEEFSIQLKKWHSKGSFFNYNGQKVFYVYDEPEDVDPTNPVIVLLHGFPTSSYDYFSIWNQFIDINTNQNGNMKEKNAIMTFDYLGYGFSDKPMNYKYSVFDMADMIEKLLLHLNIQHISIVAHDISDTVAQEMIRRDNLKTTNHYKIERCILLNGGIMTSIYEPVLSQYALRNEYLSKVIASKYVMRFGFFKFSFSRLFGEFKKPSLRDLYDFYLGIRYNDGIERLPQTIGYMNEREEYGHIWYDALNETLLPVLFIYGPADPINPRNKFPQKLRKDLPRVKLSVLSDMVGHYPHHEDSFTVFQLIKSFLLK